MNQEIILIDRKKLLNKDINLIGKKLNHLGFSQTEMILESLELMGKNMKLKKYKQKLAKKKFLHLLEMIISLIFLLENLRYNKVFYVI